MANRYDTNFVAPDAVTIEPTRTDLVRRQDVVQVVDRMIDGYMTQQRALLDQVQGEATHTGFLSDANQVMERRKTSALYLLTYGLVSALTMGGLSWIAYLAGIDGALAVGGWLAATGGLTLLLAHLSHRREFEFSPEGIAQRMIEAHWDIASYEAETRRKAIAWEHQADRQRQAAADRQAEYARQQAELRIAELDARRRNADAQRAQGAHHADRFRVVMHTAPPQTAQEGQHGASTPTLVANDLEIDSGAPSPSTADTGWQTDLLAWLAGLYEPGATTDAGIIKGRVPWAQRSSWTPADKAAAQRVCCTMRPALVVAAEGGRWRLRNEMFTDAGQALQVLTTRLTQD